MRYVDAVTTVTSLFSGRQSWNPGQTYGIRKSHKGRFVSRIVLAEPVTSGLMPLKSGRYSRVVPGPIPATVSYLEGQQIAYPCRQEVNKSPNIIMGDV